MHVTLQPCPTHLGPRDRFDCIAEQWRSGCRLTSARAFEQRAAIFYAEPQVAQFCDPLHVFKHEIEYYWLRSNVHVLFQLHFLVSEISALIPRKDI